MLPIEERLEKEDFHNDAQWRLYKAIAYHKIGHDWFELLVEKYKGESGKIIAHITGMTDRRGTLMGVTWSTWGVRRVVTRYMIEHHGKKV